MDSSSSISTGLVVSVGAASAARTVRVKEDKKLFRSPVIDAVSIGSASGSSTDSEAGSAVSSGFSVTVLSGSSVSGSVTVLSDSSGLEVLLSVVLSVVVSSFLSVSAGASGSSVAPSAGVSLDGSSSVGSSASTTGFCSWSSGRTTALSSGFSMP